VLSVHAPPPGLTRKKLALRAGANVKGTAGSLDAPRAFCALAFRPKEKPWLNFYVPGEYALNVPQGTQNGASSPGVRKDGAGIKEAVVKSGRAKRLFWLAIKAALWGALSRLVGKPIEKLMG
jgi:hypothetical protein